ncbi:MAG: YlmH/Sll1252 family protein [Eubacteriales bacterium]
MTSNPAVSRAMDKLRESEYAVGVTDFMSPAEIAEVYSNFTTRSGSGIARCFFWGGCRGAERCAAVFLPDWYLPEEAPPHALPLDTPRRDAFAAHLAANPDLREEIPIRALRIRGSGFRSLTHRDFMGGILSLGIERSTVGDIVVLSEAEALVFVLEKIAPYLVAELRKIGRDGVRTELWDVAPDYELPRRFETVEITVSSARLDGVVRALTGKSREASADMIRDGLVELRYQPTDDVSADVREGDILSVRGLGKYIIGAPDGQTRSGRLKIKCRKYV